MVSREIFYLKIGHSETKSKIYPRCFVKQFILRLYLHGLIPVRVQAPCIKQKRGFPCLRRADYANFNTKFFDSQVEKTTGSSIDTIFHCCHGRNRGLFLNQAGNRKR